MTGHSQDAISSEYPQGGSPLLVDCGPGKSNQFANLFKMSSSNWFNVQTGETIPENELGGILYEYPDSKEYYITGNVLEITSYILLAAGFISIGSSYLPAIENAQVKKILGYTGVLELVLGEFNQINARDSRRRAVQKYNLHVLKSDD